MSKKETFNLNFKMESKLESEGTSIDRILIKKFNQKLNSY